MKKIIIAVGIMFSIISSAFTADSIREIELEFVDSADGKFIVEMDELIEIEKRIQLGSATGIDLQNKENLKDSLISNFDLISISLKEIMNGIVHSDSTSFIRGNGEELTIIEARTIIYLLEESDPKNENSIMETYRKIYSVMFNIVE